MLSRMTTHLQKQLEQEQHNNTLFDLGTDYDLLERAEHIADDETYNDNEQSNKTINNKTTTL